MDMPAFILTKDMEFGVAKIDEQHRELINKINELIEMSGEMFSTEEIKKTLATLSDYVTKHFADEEELQIKCGYPKYELHKIQHKDFINKFLKMASKFPSEGATFKFNENDYKLDNQAYL